MQTDTSERYTLGSANPFLAVLGRLGDSEVRPGRTVTFMHLVDLTAIEAVRARAAAGRACKPSYTAFVVKALALALRAFPYANCRASWWPWRGPRLQQFHCCDIAVACERNLPDAPMAAFIDVLRDADRASLADITDWLHRLAHCDTSTNVQWRSFHTVITRLPGWLAGILLRLPWLAPSLWVKYRGGAAIVSSPARYGVDAVLATWPHPIGVSFGRVQDRPLVDEGQVVARPTFWLTLNFDRRVMAGAQAARFFRRLVDLLEHADSDLESPGESRDCHPPTRATLPPETTPTDPRASVLQCE